MAVKNQEPSLLHNPSYGSVSIVNADGQALKTVLTVTGSDNSKEVHVYSLNVTSDDTADRVLRIYVNSGSGDIEHGDINIPLGSGKTSGIQPMELIANKSPVLMSRIMKDARGNFYLPLRTGDILKVAALTTVTAAKTIVVSSFGYDFTRS